MKRFQRSGKPGQGPGRGSRGPKRFGGHRDGGREAGFGPPRFDQQLHPATCSICGNPCQVPFKPSGDRPIFCRDCFRKEEGGRPERGGRFERDSRPPFKRPERFEHRAPAGAQESGHIMRELEKINDKLDRIIKAMEGGE
jgi:CxxC-x17-CxxC domain-containing protein